MHYSIYHVCWCCISYVLVFNEQTNCLRIYKRLLTNPLHGKAAELCLTNSLTVFSL